MKFRPCCLIAPVLLSSVVVAIAFAEADDRKPEAQARKDDAKSAPSLEEARSRAELLHDAFHATLQEVHHAYFREDEKVVIPAVTLKKVFGELARQRKIELRWLSVNAQAMNVEHEPKSDFEKEASKAIAAGAKHFERTEGGVYRRVGAIVLTSECLKCHLPLRSSNKDRLAGLMISVPMKPE